MGKADLQIHTADLFVGACDSLIQDLRISWSRLKWEVFHIEGHPGTGKSIYMKCLTRKAREDTGTRGIFLGYFFPAGEEKASPHTSLAGLLSSLFYDLLTIAPEHSKYMLSTFEKRKSAHGTKWSWQASDLRDLLLETVVKSPGFPPMENFH
jgi:hypothetical protein